MTTWSNYSGALRGESIFSDPAYNEALDPRFYSELAMAGAEGLQRQVRVQHAQIRDLSTPVASP